MRSGRIGIDERDALVMAPALQCFPGLGVFDQNLAHAACGGAEKVRPVFKGERSRADKPQISLIHERCRL